MNYLIILILMIFCHIVDDYYLQGCLANMKQKSWWEKNASNQLYRLDYIMALFMHSFSWSFMIMLPLFIITRFNVGLGLIAFPINTLIHMIVDDLKANKRKINLIQDQLIHLFQILLTLFLFYILHII